ncbi:MAG TPA: hypothetical protein VNZ56_04890 [Verrucomicrobiae bacterium]|jgi:hypothetical protein|nr:hypothetical protein [Verrucomicrobiae bacterium]
MTDGIDSSANGSRGGQGLLIAAVAVLGVVALVGLVMAHNTSTQITEAQQAFDTKAKAIQTDLTSQIAQLQQHQAQVDTANAGLQSDLTVVTKRLRLTQSDLKKARDEAEQIRTEDQQKIAEVDATTKTELATKATTDDVKGVDGKVDVVRTDLTGTQNDLKMARSELGTLIARNHEDVEQLRRLGERDYIEFTIDAKNKPQKVGAFVVELRGTNPAKKRFNVALVVDDSRIEKKNLPINEPIFFHQGSDRRPLELVVNSVAKDKVTGYISVPKAANAQSASSD